MSSVSTGPSDCTELPDLRRVMAEGGRADEDADVTEEDAGDLLTLEDIYDIIEAFKAAIEELEEASGKRARRRLRKHRRLTFAELDEWLLRETLRLPEELLAELNVVAEHLKRLWAQDRTMHIVDGQLKYINRARSSLSQWCLNGPSDAVVAATGASPGSQNFHVVLAVLISLDGGSMKDDFIRAAQLDKPVPLESFIRDKPEISSADISDTDGGLYLIHPPRNGKKTNIDGGYFGHAERFKPRMASHNRRGANRWVRRYAEEKAPLRAWRKYAIFKIPEHWPKQIRAMCEAACIALGGFTSGSNFNVNYFDAAGFRAIASDINIVQGWLELCLQSTYNDENGLPLKFPPYKDSDDEWERRFGEAFGGGLAGHYIAEVAHGRRRAEVTSLLPRPNRGAYDKASGDVYGDIGKSTRGPFVQQAAARAQSKKQKPAEHQSEMLRRKDPNITDRSDQEVGRAPPTAEQKRAMTNRPVYEQPPEMQDETRKRAANFRKTAAKRGRGK